METRELEAKARQIIATPVQDRPQVIAEVLQDITLAGESALVAWYEFKFPGLEQAIVETDPRKMNLALKAIDYAGAFIKMCGFDEGSEKAQEIRKAL